MRALLGLALALAALAGVLYLLLASGAREQGPSAPAAAPAAPVARSAGSRAGPAAPTPASSDDRATPVDAPRVERIVAPSPGSAASVQSLSARLVGTNGPVRQARVQLFDASGTLITETTSDGVGLFVLGLPGPVERAEIVATAPGFAVYTAGPHRVQAGEKRHLGAFYLEPAVRLAGSVVGPDGQAVAGAAVSVERAGISQEAKRHRLTTTADARGRFAIDGAPSSGLRVEARADGYGGRALDPLSPIAGQDVRIELVPERALEVAVRGRGGVPIAGASVDLTALERLALNASARSDEEGHARVAGLGADQWSVRVSAPAHRIHTSPRVEIASGPLEVELLPWPCVSGRVELPDGSAPPSGTTVAVRPTDAGGIPTGALQGERNPVAADGSFRVCDLRPGQLALEAQAPGWAPTLSAVLQLRLEQDTEGIRIALRRGGRLEVGVDSAGRAVAGAEIEVLASEPQISELLRGALAPGRDALARGRTDARGSVGFEHVPAGRAWVVAHAEDLLPSVAGPFDVADGGRDQTRLELLPGGRLRGKVVYGDGRAVAGALVLFKRTDQAREAVHATTAADGGFRSPLLEPGRYALTARAVSGPGSPSAKAEGEADVAPGGESELELRLP